MTTQIKGNDTSTFGGAIQTNESSIVSNRPMFFAYLSSTPSINDGVNTTIPFDLTLFDTDSAFNTSTYRFVVPTGKAGKYFFQVSARIIAPSNTDLALSQTMIYKNGTLVNRTYTDYTANYIRTSHEIVTNIVNCAEGDYIQGFAYANTISNGASTLASGTSYTTFYGFKLIG